MPPTTPTPRSRRALRTVLRPLLGSLLLGGLVLAGASTQPVTSQDADPAFAAGCIGYCKHPTNAAKVFRWGVESWRMEFENRRGPLNGHWKTDTPGSIGQQNGMLTIAAGSGDADVKAWPDNQSAQYGRWEARVRAFERAKGDTPYRFVWELVPADGDDSCGANAIVMASYKPGTRRARGAVRTLPGTQFTFSKKLDLRSRAWHTYAVEVAPDHISWFVDTKVVRTERRPAALSGVTYRPQFELRAQPGATMRPSWMQMDWVRAYDLHRPNAKSIKARQMNQRSYSPTC